ncbi:MAG: response regulator [Candidatus Hodarchaeales archaeon]|jgi:nitrogen-specific signal transduction histidine kinase/CheY-like chemotaxis protein
MTGVINVLHVDDELSFLQLTEKYLEIIGGEELKVLSLSDPLKVFKELEEKPFDVIVTDYQMPGMDGLELLSRLRDQNNDIPVIIFTGRGREEVAINALNLGASYYIDKGGDPQSQFIELRHVIQQVVKHKRIEKALSENMERYRIIFDESPVSLWEEDFSAVKNYFDHLRAQGITDLRQYLDENHHEVEKLTQMVKIIDVNTTTLKVYNAKDISEFHEGLDTFFDEESTFLFKEELIALFNGATVFQSEFPGYKLTGEKINVIVRLSVVSGYEGTLEKIIVSVIDITQLKTVEETLRRQKEELSEFAHFIAHDINNCLTTIEGYTQLLDLEYDETHIISRQIKYMKELLSRSLTLADAGLAIEKSSIVDLNYLIDRVVQTTIPKSIVFSHDKLPEVLCDEEKLAQVFRNIFENAIIHGKPNKIETKIMKDNEYLKILVINDGVPIAPKVQERIFDYGFTTLKDSMGLGLSIVRKIIEAHGWYISVESSHEQTSFQISIPLRVLRK